MSDKPTNPKDTLGIDRVPIHLWPNTATIEGAMALLAGTLKYGRANWRVAGVRTSIYYDALRRHIDAMFEGEREDPETGLPHEAHALACLAILVDARAAGKLTDDAQYPGGYRAKLTEMTPHVARLKKLYEDRSPKHYTRDDADKEKAARELTQVAMMGGLRPPPQCPAETRYGFRQRTVRCNKYSGHAGHHEAPVRGGGDYTWQNDDDTIRHAIAKASS